VSEKLWPSFPIAAKKDWLHAAQKELKGEDPLLKLTHRTGNIDIAPYYDETDLPDTHLFVLEPSKNQWSEPRYWVNSPNVVVREARDANLISLQHLQSGADGISFHIANPEISIQDLLAGIQLPYCTILFSGNITPAFVSSFCSFAGKNFNASEVHGAMFHAKPETIASSITEFRGFSNFFGFGVEAIQLATVEETLSNVLVRFVNTLDGGVPQQLAAHTGVSLNVTHDLFTNIAMLKALRILCSGVQTAYGISPTPIFVHARCNPWKNEYLQPHENMLAGTTAGMAAVLGGCDALTVMPANQSDALENRIARNVSLLLKEEARLSLTADPTAGSYYLESLINTLVNNSWADFLRIVKS
jgi:methylmalonyl-CoA mutase